ncbi:hypothetical protein [Methanococcoides seepicolus]|uniref:Alpha-galactosidase NEW3 domain-containing protein n=1 Tax=Methanococcoides seepicolus TaxID=2828780 RepID=A0A9E4ZHR9_9EURY|nr:hypothetical protein [Methanococcoides seepicolus]MCM1987856.1 hypothetical protein [Methanococcoides seepicolus]
MCQNNSVKALLLVFFVLLSPASSIASADWGTVVATSETTGKVAISGDIIEFPITVQRGHNSSEKAWIGLSVSSAPENWDVGFYEENGQILFLNFPENENKKRNVILRVKTPSEANDGVYSVWVNFVPDEGDISIQEFVVKIDSDADINMQLYSAIPGLETSPAEPVEFIVTIENNYDHRIKVNLDVLEKSEDWDIQLLEIENKKYRITKQSLEKNSKQDFIVRVNPPIDTVDGSYTITVAVTPENGPQSAKETLELEINGNIETNEALVLIPEEVNLILSPGSDSEIYVTIKNTGIQQLENVELRMQDVSGISTDVRMFGAIDKLDSGESKEIPVQISVRADASSGSKDILMRAISDTTNSEDGTIAIVVERSESSGFFGVGLILISICVLGLIIYKFGRR